ncbi:MAG: YceI family protein [Vicinamibacterales bacterium]
MSATTFVIDPSHSEALFTVRHLITKVRGRFREFAGSIQFDEAAPERSSVTFTIQAGSIDTNEPNRDTHLRSADFFDVEKTPTITFVSATVARASEHAFTVTGTLTIHGISREVTLPVSFHGFAKDPWGNRRAGFEIETTINRKEYGLNWNAALEAGGFLVGDEVHVTLSIQAIAQG